jgi:DNA-binding NarL/FixJ family response regulator
MGINPTYGYRNIGCGIFGIVLKIECRLKPLGLVMKKITVLLADDHSVVREGLQALLQAESDLQVVGQASTGVEAVELSVRLRPDVVVLDIAMPVLNGVEALRQIRASVPGTRVLILSAYCNPACIEQVVALGAAGYLIKKTSILILAQAIREVQQGRCFLDPAIHVATGLAPGGVLRRTGTQAGHSPAKEIALTSREIEVLKLIAEGLLNKQVADRLGISAKTTEKHRYSLMEKLAIHDTAGLTRYAIELGLAEPTSETVA